MNAVVDTEKNKLNQSTLWPFLIFQGKNFSPNSISIQNII